MSAEMREIEELLASRIGLDPVSVGTRRIPSAVRQRMAGLGLQDLRTYHLRLRDSESELQALIDEVVVSESWFFRDERPFQLFREHARLGWALNPSRPALRVLSLPCAGGEEPYSIAIALLELGIPPQRFQIDAVDISAHRLAIARRGVFTANAFRGSELAFRAQYFHQNSHGFDLIPRVRSAVRFHQASVLDPMLLAGHAAYDVVFCRNLLIYLSKSAQRSVLTAIDRLLTPDGILFIGHADRLADDGAQSRFAPFGDPGCFAYRHSIAPRAIGIPSTSEVLRQTYGTLTPAETPISSGSVEIQSTHKAESSSTFVASESRTAFLDQAAELANHGRFDEALIACERELRQKGSSPTAYYLMGMIAQAAGDRPRAEDCFHKTVYLDPRHDERSWRSRFWQNVAVTEMRRQASAAGPSVQRPRSE